MRVENLLVELGTEELPPKALAKLASAFCENLQAELSAVEFEFETAQWFASPRRLAVEVKQLAEQQQDKIVEKRGPAVSAAFDDSGQPTKAAEGWARSNGISVDQAERLKTDKGEWLLYKAEVKGKHLSELLSGLVEKALKRLPIPKPMRWGAKATQFIRPVHTFTQLYGNELVPGMVLGLKSGRKIQGHRFHGEKHFELDHADNYLAELQTHYVLADHQQRKIQIQTELERVATLNGAKADIDDDLLDEVTALVEWPVVLTAGFEKDFLSVPKEALIYTMKDDQKYFPLLSENGDLLDKFLFVSNIESNDPDQVIKGNEKVIRPRLADARFFFETDKKQSLESRLPSLESVLFQKQLGTLKDKSERIAELAGQIATKINASSEVAHRAGLLAKTDLMTNMVMEFPDVQGVMGMHYARHDGEQEDVALALDEQYKPRFAGDELPSNPISISVALADKLDTLVGIFGIGQTPKGDKDPFALRRAAIGVLRIIVENKVELDLEDLVTNSHELLGDKLTHKDCKAQVVDFVLGRFRTWYQEQGVDIDVIQAVEAKRPTRPSDFAARIKGVTEFKKLDSAQALAAANKRVANILNKNKVDVSTEIDPQLFESDQEKALASQLQEVQSNIAPLIADGSYGEILQSLSSLRTNIDAFFDNVMVMAEDDKVRNNRLALLSKLREAFLFTADISLLSK